MLVSSSKEVQDYLEKERNKVWEKSESRTREEILSDNSGKTKSNERAIREELLKGLKVTEGE